MLTQQEPIAPRAPGNEVAGTIAIWTAPGVIGDTGAATAPGALTVTGALTVPTLTISVALNLPGGETAASQPWVTTAIINAIAALTIAGLPAALMTELDTRYVRREPP